jgi:TonB family protein
MNKRIVFLILSILSFRTNAQNNTYEVVQEDSARYKMEIGPYFDNGKSELYSYIKKNLKYPKDLEKDSIRGIVPASFIIDKEGKVKDIKIRLKLGHGCDEEVMRLIENMPDWSPCKRDGVPMDVTYFLNISFGDPKERDSYYVKGVQAIHDSDIASANKYFNYALIVNPLDKDALFNRAVLRAKYDDMKGACEDWSKASRLGDTTARRLREKYCPEKENTNPIHTVVETMPFYPGGEEALFIFLQKSIKYPAYARENDITGRVYVTFVVDTTGEINRIRILRAPHKVLAEESLRVISLMPNWTPGKQDGKKVAVQYNLPVNFNLR